MQSLYMSASVVLCRMNMNENEAVCISTEIDYYYIYQSLIFVRRCLCHGVVVVADVPYLEIV